MFLLLTAIAAPAGAQTGRGAARIAPPNVILITIDTLRPDHLSCYGYERLRTTNIDALAADGVLFEKAYTPVPITLPSHGSLFTGTYPMRTGLHDFSGNRLNPEQPTLAGVLRRRGYATGAVVGAAVLDSRFGLNSGFDFYYDRFDFNRMLETNLDAMERPGNVVADEALAWLRKNAHRRFLLWMHLYDPHHPYNPPAPYDQQYADSPYDGEIAFADAQVGRIISYLKQQGLYGRTLIVLAGDHGEGLGEHGEKTHGFFIYNTTMRVPLIVKPAAREAATVKRVAEPVNLVDVLPTTLELLKLPVPPEVQGRSLLPLLRGQQTERVSDLYGESFLPRLHFNWSELRGIQVENYHFIDAPKPELYDVAADPSERTNLIEQKPAVASELQKKLADLIVNYSAGKEMAEKTGLDPAMAERLQALGYAAFSGGGNPTISNRELPDPKDRIEMYELVSEALNLSQRGRYDESIENLKKAVAIEPTSVPTHYLLGLNYYRKQDWASAAIEFELVLKASPDYTLAVFNLGLAKARLGEREEAARLLRRTLELDPSNFTAAFDLGALLLRMQRVPESLEAFRQSIRILPSFGPAHRAIGEVLLYQGKPDEALVSLRTALRLMPNNSAVRVSIAKALEMKGLHQQAQEELRKARSGGSAE
ncbi:MAG TPA: sulfatase-like hydrolase/transferase [Terriglobales bacterium]|nr:sulfatase-like hydrolase/transferase [Terriglobales bacterium]